MNDVTYQLTALESASKRGVGALVQAPLEPLASHDRGVKSKNQSTNVLALSDQMKAFRYLTINTHLFWDCESVVNKMSSQLSEVRTQMRKLSE